MLLLQILRAQQCGVPDHGLRTGAERLVGTAQPEEEDSEEAEAQGQEESGEEEGKAETQTANALWCP